MAADCDAIVIFDSFGQIWSYQEAGFRTHNL